MNKISCMINKITAYLNKWLYCENAFDAFACFLTGFTGVHPYPSETRDNYIARNVVFCENLAHSLGGHTHRAITAILFGFAGYIQVITGQYFNQTIHRDIGNGHIVKHHIKVSEYIASNVAMAYAAHGYLGVGEVVYDIS